MRIRLSFPGMQCLILAYQFMMKECPLECVERVMEVFGRTALEVCEGQQWTWSSSIVWM